MTPADRALEPVTCCDATSTDAGDANIEYDVPRCLAGTDPSQQTAYAISLQQEYPPGTVTEYNQMAFQTLERVLRSELGLRLTPAEAHGATKVFLDGGWVGVHAQASALVDTLLTLRRSGGYDHSYYFVASFIGDHIAHHAATLCKDRT